MDPLASFFIGLLIYATVGTVFAGLFVRFFSHLAFDADLAVVAIVFAWPLALVMAIVVPPFILLFHLVRGPHKV